jgi:endonuclease/exonuclease/phosphatase family metal-dependent hydrolase
MRFRLAVITVAWIFSPMIMVAQSTDTTLEVVSWNIEWFGSPAAANGPADKNLQEANVGKLLKWMNADLYGLVEVVDTMRMRRVVDFMGSNDFGYVISPYCTQATQPSGNAWLTGQKMAFVYRKSVFSNVTTRGMMRNSATANASWASGRFPFMLSATVTLEGVSKPMNFIVIHAKAGSTQSDYDKRRAGAQELKDTLDLYYSTTMNLIIGDFNDALNTSIYPGTSISSYQPIVSDSTDADHYKSITLPLGAQGQTSMIGYPNVVDNHMISNEVMPFFIRSSVKIKTDVVTQVSDYVTAKNTSDHYPVLSRYDLNGTILTSLPVLSFSAAGITAWPNPVRTDLYLRSDKLQSHVQFRIHDAQGRLVLEEKMDRWQSGSSLRIPMEGQKPGVYFLEVLTDNRRMLHRFLVD